MSLIGQTLQDRYYISHQIGEGGMGRVYYAEDTRLNQVVAIKETLKPANEPSQQIAARVKAFQREAHLLAGKVKHHAVPRVIDYFQFGDNWYIVMDYVDGDSLETQLKERGQPFSLKEVLFWTDQLLEILDSLHSGVPPIVHRDIKPSNIKVINDKVYLLDFGLAKQLKSSKSSVALFTLAFSSPEQMENKEPTEESDIYSVGATMYCLLTNTEPDSAFSRSLAIASGGGDPLPHIKEMRADLPDELADLIMSALSIKLEDRPHSAKIMRASLMEKDKTPPRSPRVLSTAAFNVEDIEEKKENSSSPEKDESRSSSSAFKTLVGAPSIFNPEVQADAPPHKTQNWKKVVAVLGVLIVIAIAGVGIYLLIRKPPAPVVKSKPPRQIATEKTEQAMEMLYINDYEKAKALSREAIESDPTYALAHAIHGDAFWDADQVEEDSSKDPKTQICQGEILKIFDAKEPATEEDFAARAWAFIVDRKWDKAKQDIEKVVAKRPDWAWALMQRAFVVVGRDCVKEKGSKESLEAIDTLKRVNTLKPTYAMAYMNLGGEYLCHKQNQEALAAYEQAIKLLQLPKFYVGRGVFYLNSIEKKTKDKNIENARKDFEAALKIDPEFSVAHVGLAEAHLIKDEYQGCISETDKALAKKPSFDAYYWRAVCRRSLAYKDKDEKGFDEALENLEKAKEKVNRYSNATDEQDALARYYSEKSNVHYSKAFYLYSEKYLKSKTTENKNRVRAELENAQASIQQAHDINQDKDSDKDYAKRKAEIEKTIRLFKRV